MQQTFRSAEKHDPEPMRRRLIAKNTVYDMALKAYTVFFATFFTLAILETCCTPQAVQDLTDIQ